MYASGRKNNYIIQELYFSNIDLFLNKTMSKELIFLGIIVSWNRLPTTCHRYKWLHETVNRLPTTCHSYKWLHETIN
jgi:hypothetical protein